MGVLGNPPPIPYAAGSQRARTRIMAIVEPNGPAEYPTQSVGGGRAARWSFRESGPPERPKPRLRAPELTRRGRLDARFCSSHASILWDISPRSVARASAPDE